MPHDTTPAGRPLLTEDQAAEFLGFTPSFLQARRYRGTGPAYVRISQRAVRYRPEDLEQWLEERTYTSTAEETVAAGGDGGDAG